MLRDLSKILDKPENSSLTEDDFQKAASIIRRKQFIWSDGHGQSKYYKLSLKFQDYFGDLFHAFGDEFIIDNHYGYCGILPNSPTPSMKLLDTIFLLILAKLYDGEARKACIENGRAHPSPALLIDTYIELTGKEKPKLGDTQAALSRLQSAGIILLGDKEDISELRSITVLPTISVVLNEQHLVLLEQFTLKHNQSLEDEFTEKNQDPISEEQRNEQ